MSLPDADKKIAIKSIIVIDKPHGITSMTVVRRLRQILKPIGINRIGYAGTLDPYATGVLVVGIGKEGTKQLGVFSDRDKEYICEIDLLKDTISGDMDGFIENYQKVLPPNKIIPTIEQIHELINTTFIGEITQLPPKLSAIKINGKKACDMVRKNIEFEMKERQVKIYAIDILAYDFPVLKLKVKCSKGTYIRTLGQDIGKKLGLWGSLLSLRRTSSGEYTLDDTLILNNITLDDLYY